MVAKINRGVSLYGAVIYNQQKVNESMARIISGNRMIADVTGNPEHVMRNTLWAFENYLLANRNTEKPVLHISLNPSADDKLTDSQFADLAREYMQKMGYGDQPYIVYIHEDIDRRHIHIVSTCVNEKGEKIDDAYEWNRSMEACRELERKFGLKQVGGQTQGTVGAVPQESGLSEWRCKATSFQHPQKRVLHLPFPVIRGSIVRCCPASTSRRNRSGANLEEHLTTALSIP